MHMFAVTADIFGIFGHGKLKGRVDPKQRVSLTVYGATVKQATAKINRITEGAVYNIASVRNLDKAPPIVPPAPAALAA